MSTGKGAQVKLNIHVFFFHENELFDKKPFDSNIRDVNVIGVKLNSIHIQIKSALIFH